MGHVVGHGHVMTIRTVRSERGEKMLLLLELLND